MPPSTHQCGAGHIVGLIRRQPYGRLGNIGRIPNASIGNELQELLFRLWCLPCRSIDRGPDRARSDRIHADASLRHLLRQTFHHHQHTALRCPIVDVTLPGDGLVYRTHANDLSGSLRKRSCALLREGTDRFSCAEKLASQIDVDDTLPLSECHLTRNRVHLDS